MIAQERKIPVFSVVALTLTLTLTLVLMLWGCGEETSTETPKPKEEAVSQPEPLQFSQYLPGQPGSFWKYSTPNGAEVTRTVSGIEQSKTGATYLALKSDPAPQSKPIDEKALIVQTLLELPNIRYRGTSGGDVVINTSDLRTTVDSMLRKKFDKNIKASKDPSISSSATEWTLIKAPLSEGANWEVVLASVSGTITRKKEQGERTRKGGVGGITSSFSGSIEIRAKATAKESIKTPAGSFDAIKVDYKLISRELNPDQDTPDITTEDLLTHWVVAGTGIVQSASKDGNTWQLVAFEIK